MPVMYHYDCYDSYLHKIPMSWFEPTPEIQSSQADELAFTISWHYNAERPLISNY